VANERPPTGGLLGEVHVQEGPGRGLRSHTPENASTPENDEIHKTKLTLTLNKKKSEFRIKNEIRGQD